MTQQEINVDIKDGISTWEEIGNSNIPVFYLYYYYPTSCGNMEDYQEWARQLIWDFKDGDNTSEVVDQVTTVLKHFFLEETLSSLTFVCIPASTRKKNQSRYEDFSNEVATECDMWDGYDHIELKYDREAKHVGGDEDFDNLRFERSWFNGKSVIIFDDIITKGDSINNMARKLRRLGAKVIGAITLGRTVHHDRGEDPYDNMNKSIKRKRHHHISSSSAAKVSSSAEESATLYRRYRSVSRVASYRGLAESTVYGHLFNTGTLDPNEYITDDEYGRAEEIYDSGDYEQPSLELDEFLDAAGKAAFYYIRRNN